MQIAWLCHRDPGNPASGGAERVTIELGKRFVEAGDDFRVVSSGWRGCRPRETILGVQIVRFPGPIAAHASIAFLDRFVPEVDVVVDDLAHVVPWASPLLTRHPGTAFFHHLHDRTLDGQVSRRAAGVLRSLERLYPIIYRKWPFVTESIRAVEDLVTLGVAPERIVRIPPGVDCERFVPGVRSKVPLVVYFSGLREYKRPEHAILAFRRLVENGASAKLVVVGEGPMLPELRQESADLGKRVQFVGRLSQEALARLLSSAWAHVECSVAEGWGLTALEAAASGIPTVAYSVPGIDESVVDGETGLLVRDGDVEQLAAALGSVLASSQRWERRCVQRAREFSWEHTFKAWRGHLLTVLDNAPL